MGTLTRTSGKAVAAFFAGVLFIACGVLVLLSEFGLFLVGIVLFFGVAVVLGWLALVEIERTSETLTGRSIVGCGVAFPIAALSGGGWLDTPEDVS